jgi:hypothetical protein
MYILAGFVFYVIYVVLIAKYFKEKFTSFTNGIMGNYSSDDPTLFQKSVILLVMFVLFLLAWIIIVPLTILLALFAYAIKILKL